MTACPCGTGNPLDRCCGPLLDGTPAPTALALMRSRYTAYVRGAVDYLIDTHDASTRGTADRDGIAAWSRQTEWLGLEILATERGGAEHDDGIVEFIARGRNNGAPFAQHERSRFRRVDGRWYYIDGRSLSPAVSAAEWQRGSIDGTAGRAPVRVTASIGRNDACPCGSGQKYKRCHGR